MENINSTMNLYRNINKNNRAAIDEFFAARACRAIALATAGRAAKRSA
jgi:hypothetical protein